MDRIKNNHLPLKRLTPEDGSHYFFGYYDLQPYDIGMKRYLCHRTAFMDRLPQPEDEAEIGYIDIGTGVFHAIARTRAWNFQQGSMLQWYDENRILYNVYDNGIYKSAIKNVGTGHTETLPLPLATANAKKGYGLSVNFSRIYDFRAGYGYAGIPDPYAYENAPAGDGVFLVNLKTKECRQIIGYRELAESFPHAPYTTECKIVVNHISFNPSGDRFIFLLRNFPKPGIPWITMLLSSDLGGNTVKHTDFFKHSHYSWRDDGRLLMESDYLGRWGLHMFNIDDCEAEYFDAPVMNAQGVHCNYSPDRRYILGDAYPEGNNYRALFLHDTYNNKTERLADFYSDPISNGDIRCDLHARWSPDGKKISFDTTHNGKREIYEMELLY